MLPVVGRPGFNPTLLPYCNSRSSQGGGGGGGKNQYYEHQYVGAGVCVPIAYTCHPTYQ